MKYRAIIFDFNGVLLWDTPWHKEAWQELAAELCHPAFTEEEWGNLQGRATTELLPRLFHSELSAEEITSYAKLKDTLYRTIALAHRSNLQLSPGAERLLDLLVEKRIPCAIATSSESDDMSFFVDNLQLDTWFEVKHIICSDGTFPSKPAPDVYLRAAQSITVPISECIVVDDSVSGITAAATAKAGNIIGLGPKVTHALLLEAGAHRVIESLEEVGPQDF